MGHLEPRRWELRNHLSDTKNDFDREIQDLREKTDLSELTLRVCLMRGLSCAEAIESYLYPRLDQLQDPYSIHEMDRAVERLSLARERKESVRVFGDYDVDGTAGSALLAWVFRDFGFVYDVRQPDRFKDGYGLNVGAVEEAFQAGVRVLVTVDCGITSFDAAKKADELGIDLVMIDHHQVDEKKGLPIAYAIVNPQKKECSSGLKQLCGCGLAFYFSMALRRSARERGWFGDQKEPNLKQHLDLVVLATAADMVPLVGDNRILVRHGLEVLRTSPKPGLKALMEVAGLGSRSLSPGHLGFVLGPRINASGRMQNASLAHRLLTTQEGAEGIRMAHELERLNSERAEVQNKIWDQVRKRVEEGIEQGFFKNAIAVADEGWHEGVVGIVASRVTEFFRRPAAVISLREGKGKGSVRSFAGKDVLGALRECENFLVGFGGHKFAAGLNFEASHMESFAKAFDEAIGKQKTEMGDHPPLLIEGVCQIEDFDMKTMRELENLGPFGPGNPEPVFQLMAEVRTQRILKGRHLKLNLGPVGQKGPSIEAIWFHAAEREDWVEETTSGKKSKWAGVPELNRYHGRVTPTLRVKDWKKE